MRARTRWTACAPHYRHGIIVWRRATASSCNLALGYRLIILTQDRWPVIVAIIVGSLIVLSVVVCVARCICCGAECAICCCKCCTCCCGSSGRSGHKRVKSEPTPSYPPYAAAGAPNPYAQNPYAQAHAAAPPAPFHSQPLNQQYRSHAAPAFAPAPAHTNEPQFATFASSNKAVNEDALPAMPSWGDARDRHVEVEEEALPPRKGDMEMDRLNHNGSVNSASMATGMAAVGTRRSPGPGMSPVSPAGDSYGYNQGFEKEPLVGGAPHRSPHASPAPYGRPYAQQDDYRRGSPAQNLSPAYGAGEGYAHNQPYDRHSPAPQQQSYNQHDHRGQYDYEDNYSQAQTLPPYRSPSPPTQNTYNYNANNASYDDYAAPSAPVRAHTPGYSQPLHAPAAAAYESSELSAEPISAYPGQRSYTPQSAYPGQANYQAFNPGQTGPQFSGVQRKGVPGSFREI